MDRAQVTVDPRVGNLERLFEGVTVEGRVVWFNVVHEGVEDHSPVSNVGGQYGAKDGVDMILLRRQGDAYLDLITGACSRCEPAASWEASLPWEVSDGVWKEVERRVVLPRVAQATVPELRP
jgi:hypothetical protein